MCIRDSSYTGEALDYKTPLLKALGAVDKAATEVCRMFDPDVYKRQIHVPAEWHPANGCNCGLTECDSEPLLPPEHRVPHWEHTYSDKVIHTQRCHR